MVGCYEISFIIFVFYCFEHKQGLADPSLKDVEEINKVNAHAFKLYQSGKYSQATALIEENLKNAKRLLRQEHPTTLATANALGFLYQAQGRYALAEPLYKRALEASERVLGKEHPDTLRSVHNLALLYYARKNWLLAEGLLDRGTSGYARRTSLTGLQSLSGRVKTVAQRKSFAFKVYLKAAHQLGQTASDRQKRLGQKTFACLQWTQGAGASAALSQMAARFGAGNDRLAGLVRERQDLVRDWKKFDALFNKAVGLATEKRNAQREKNIQARLKQIANRTRDIDAVFTRDFPDYAALANPKPLDVKAVQAELQDDEALVYFVDTPKWESTPEETFIWLITKNDFKWVRPPLGTLELTSIVNSLHCGLDAVGWQDEKRKKLCQGLLNTKYSHSNYMLGQKLPFRSDLAYNLYTNLFGQIKDRIKGKKLLPVPSGPLTSLPFQVLLTEKPQKGQSYGDMKWLVQSHNLTVLPSVASLKSLRRNAGVSKAPNPFFGVGNPLLVGSKGTDKSAWTKQACRFEEKTKPLNVAGWVVPQEIAKFFRGGQVNLESIRRQSPLPETADELCEVARVLGAKENAVKLGKFATETNLKKLSADGTLKQARVLHFATHGLLAGETETLLKNRAEPSAYSDTS